MQIKLRVRMCQVSSKCISDEDEPDFTTRKSDQFVRPLVQLPSPEEIETSLFNKDLKSCLQQIEFLYEDKQYYSCFDLVQQVKLKLQDNRQYLKQLIEQFGQSTYRLFCAIEHEMQEIQKMREWFKLQNNWIVETSRKDLSVKYQQLPNTDMIVVRIETEVKLPLTVFLGLIYETDLYPQWFPFCAECTTLIQPDKSTKIIRSRLALPILSDREMYIKGWGVNNMEYDGRLYVLVRSIDEDPDEMNKFKYQIHSIDSLNCPTNSKLVRGFIHLFSFEITPMALDHHKVTVLSCFDLRFKGIPTYFPNMFARKFAARLFDQLISNGRKYKGSQWEKNQQKSPEFYDWMHKAVEEHFSKSQQQLIQH